MTMVMLKSYLKNILVDSLIFNSTMKGKTIDEFKEDRVARLSQNIESAYTVQDDPIHTQCNLVLQVLV